MGCDVAQGYYFSRPLPEEEYEQFLIARKEIDDAEGLPEERLTRSSASRTLQEKFAYDAMHDPVTGMYNHSGFELLYNDADKEHIALLVTEVEGYNELPRKEADAAALHVAEVLRRNFRSVDYICRLQKDQFGIILTRVNSSVQGLISEKVEQINRELAPMVLVTGAAFSDRSSPRGDIIQDADAALDLAKKARKNACVFF